MGDNPQNVATLATAAPQREDGGNDTTARVQSGSILASYLRTVLQAYVTKHVHHPAPAASTSNAADHRLTKPPPPSSPPLPASKAVSGLGEFNSKWNWLKGCRKAARLGKGLASQSGGEPALLLQCEHWLEATDPKHRYGAHLRPYYTHWLQQQQEGEPPASLLREDFFFWLDEGGGRGIDLAAEGVPRDKLEATRVRYLTYEERERCEVLVGEDGLLRYKRSGQLVHTYDLEETLDDIHMRHTSRTSAPAAPHPPRTPHLPPAGPRLSDAPALTPLQLKSTASTPAPAPAPSSPLEPAQQQQQWNGRLRRTLSAPGDGAPLDGADVELDGLPSAQWLAAQQQEAQQQQPQQEAQQQQPQQEAQQQQQTEGPPGSPAPAQDDPAAAADPLPADPPAAAGAAAGGTAQPEGTPQHGGAAQPEGPRAAAGGGGAEGAGARAAWLQPGPVAVLGHGKKEKCGWIYVMDTSCRIYVHRKERGQFHHSSFLSGAAVLAAGGLEVRQGRIEKLSAHSGHYRPDEATFAAFLEFLQQQGADLTCTRVLGVSRPKPAPGAGGGAGGPPPTPVRTALLMRRNSV